MKGGNKMNIKKEAHERIVLKLRDEQRDLKHEISCNKFKIKMLANEQAIKKRQLAEIENLIRSIGVNPNKL